MAQFGKRERAVLTVRVNDTTTSISTLKRDIWLLRQLAEAGEKGLKVPISLLRVLAGPLERLYRQGFEIAVKPATVSSLTLWFAVVLMMPLEVLDEQPIGVPVPRSLLRERG